MNNTARASTFPVPRPIVVVLGSGRSGTSLLMQVLAALGMAVSEHLIEPRRDNPEGYFEDAGIVRVHADLMRELGAWPYHRLPKDWVATPAAARAAHALDTLLRQRLAGCGGIWGFKDPRTASFLPLWQTLFKKLGITPRYVLALRQPGSVIRSFMAAYQTPAEVAEQVWLQRTADALWHTRATCHNVHYEDWFQRPVEQSAALARFCGLKWGDRPEEWLESVIRPDLNRAAGTDSALGSQAARTLWSALSACRGDDFRRDELLQVVAACRPHF